MSGIGALRAALIAGIAAIAPCHAAEVWPSEARASLPAQWSDGVAGRTLVAVDGSSATLTAREGGYGLTLTAADGPARNLAFTFVGPQLGTIAADGDAAHVLGVFRETDTGIEAQFADGSRQSLVANIAGGLSLTLHPENGASTCTSWFPGDHKFPAAERRAALAAYAEKLGLAKPAVKAAHEGVCVAAIKNGRNTGETPPTILASARPLHHPHANTVADAPLMAISVRDSTVHPVDAVAATSLQIGTAALNPALALAQPLSAVPAGRGASQCLTVESDGANFGFRNQCDYSVQFAYCLQQSTDPAQSCDAEAKAGAVAAKAFAAVLLDSNIKSGDAEHNFRWVACSGAIGEITAHLDRAEPPTGRCIHTNLAHS